MSMTYRGEIIMRKKTHKEINSQLLEISNQLFKAVENSDLTSIQEIISKGGNINIVNKDGCSLLEESIWNGNIEIIDALITSGADINQAFGINHDMLLHFVLDVISTKDINNVDVLQLLLEKGVNIEENDRDNEEGTPLHYAILTNNIKAVDLLIKKGADCNSIATCDGETPVFYAASEIGNIDAIKLLINAGADINIPNIRSSMWTPLMVAIYYRHEEIVRILIAAGADVTNTDIDSKNALDIASGHCSIDIINLLIEKGSDVNNIDSYSETPLREAVICNSINVIKVLIALTTDINQVSNSGDTVLHSAMRRGNGTIMSTLIKAGADINIKDNKGKTPLQYLDKSDRSKCRKRTKQMIALAENKRTKRLQKEDRKQSVPTGYEYDI